MIELQFTHAQHRKRNERGVVKKRKHVVVAPRLPRLENEAHQFVQTLGIPDFLLNLSMKERKREDDECGLEGNGEIHGVGDTVRDEVEEKREEHIGGGEGELEVKEKEESDVVVEKEDFDEQKGEMSEPGFDAAGENLRMKRGDGKHIDRVFDTEEKGFVMMIQQGDHCLSCNHRVLVKNALHEHFRPTKSTDTHLLTNLLKPSRHTTFGTETPWETTCRHECGLRGTATVKRGWHAYFSPFLHSAFVYVGAGEIGTLFSNCHHIGQIGDIHLLLLENHEKGS